MSRLGRLSIGTIILALIVLGAAILLRPRALPNAEALPAAVAPFGQGNAAAIIPAPPISNRNAAR